MEMVMEMNKESNEVSITNAKLRKVTDKIFTEADKVQHSLLYVAYLIADVESSELYKSDFKSVHEWTQKCFGLKKTASYSLLKIGKEYVRVNKLKNGRVTVESNLPHDGKDFSTTQIEKMLPLGHDKAVDLVKDSVIKPDDSVSMIKTCVKAFRESENIEEVKAMRKNKGTKKITGEVVDKDSDKDVVTVTDIAGNEYRIPKEVLKRYAV